MSNINLPTLECKEREDINVKARINDLMEADSALSRLCRPPTWGCCCWAPIRAPVGSLKKILATITDLYEHLLSPSRFRTKVFFSVDFVIPYLPHLFCPCMCVCVCELLYA